MRRTGYVPLGKRCPHGLDSSACHTCVAATEFWAKRPTFPRADPEALQAFNPSTKTCVMNCGPHMLDPRGANERKFLCDECVPSPAPNDLSHNRRSTNDEDLKWL